MNPSRLREGTDLAYKTYYLREVLAAASCFVVWPGGAREQVQDDGEGTNPFFFGVRRRIGWQKVATPI